MLSLEEPRPWEDNSPNAHKRKYLHLLQRCRGARPDHTRLLALLALTVLLLLGAASTQVLRRAAQNAFRIAYYSLDPLMLGRDDSRFPSPSCCAGAACAAPRTGRVAVLSYIRGDGYLPLLRQLECTLRKSNPELEFGAMVVRGELSDAAVQWMEGQGMTIVEVEPLSYPNHFAPRYAANWLKLRALSLVQYDAVLLLDSDLVVLDDLSPLFSLPVEFAASWDQPSVLGRWGPNLKGINGGVLLLRPCPAVEQHMLQLLASHPKLHFAYGAAEQDFFNWYFRFTGMMLPLEYNTMASDSLRGNSTVGGRHPAVVHFTRNKPFCGPQPGKPGHQFLCSAEEVRERGHSLEGNGGQALQQPVVDTR